MRVFLRVLALTTIVGLCACRSAHDDPATLFAQAEELRLAYDAEASREAILKYRDARDAWIRRGDRSLAARASQKLGSTYEQLGLLEDARREHLEAASLCENSCDPLLESSIFSEIGYVGALLGHQSALGECQRALSLARSAPGAREEAEALVCAGESEYNRGNLNEALELYRQARTAWARDSDPRGRAEALYHEGAVLSDLSRFAEAGPILEQALSLSVSSGDARGEAMGLVALGRLEQRRGEYQTALNLFTRALERLERSGDLVWEASALAGIGGVYLVMGDGARSLSYWEPALKRIEKTGLHTATWDLLVVVGNVHLTLEDPGQALKRFQQGLELAEKTTSDLWKQAYSLHFMGVAHRAAGLGDESLKCLERALALQQTTSDPRLEGAIRAELGNTYDALGRYPQALDSFGRALTLSDAAQDRMGVATSLFGMARVASGKKDLDAARDYVERALDVAESLRTAVESRELRTSYFASIHRFHELHVDVLMRLDELRPGQGFSAAAFAASERARARSLLESLIEAGVDIREGVDPGLLEREETLKHRLAATARTTLDEVRDLEAQLDLVQAEIRSKSPRYGALTRREPLVLEEVQRGLLDDDTLLLEYELGEERSFLWALSKQELESFELGPRAQIEEDANRLYELLTARARIGPLSLLERKSRLEEADRAYWEAAARLSEELLEPVLERIAGKKIVVVADGALQYLPFGALPLPRSASEVVPLIVAHEVVNLPSASTLAVLRQETLEREQPKGTVAVFADPVFGPDDPRLAGREGAATERAKGEAVRGADLEGREELRIPRLEESRQEAKAIVSQAPPGTTFQAIGFDASRSIAMSPELGQYRILHFATHGVSNLEHPSMSGVLLSMFDRDGRAIDGFLRLHDVYDLELSADLVVLSACNTALGKQIRGEGVIGIVRAFLYAGAERVVATLWRVDDEATRELMSRFYREMFERHRSPSAALRNAQLSMWRDTEWRAPFFWAAFVLQGEWRER